jgi:DNA-binding LacI/PurR family transcriptional regulator
MAITIWDIARTAHVSTATVSRALNRPDVVDPATRERVCAAAKAMGYQPNRAAQALKTGRTGNVGVIISDFENLCFPDILKGIQQRSAAVKLTPVLAYGGDNGQREWDVVERIISQVDGIVLCGTQLSDDRIADIRRSVPVVVIDREVPGVPSVGVDPTIGTRQAVNLLKTQGHNTLGYLGGSPHSPIRIAARHACTSAGLKFVELSDAEPTFDNGIDAAEYLVDAGISAVLAHSDLFAAGLLRGLAARNVSVPGQISVVGYGDIALARMTSTPLTTVNVPRQQAGKDAVELLQRADPASSRQDSTRLLATKLVVRQSTGAVHSGHSNAQLDYHHAAASL